MAPTASAALQADSLLLSHQGGIMLFLHKPFDMTYGKLSNSHYMKERL